jgi:hypothetical protein
MRTFRATRTSTWYTPASGHARRAGFQMMSADNRRRRATTFSRLANGEGGIRTHGGVTHTGFQDRRLEPLGHLSQVPFFSANSRYSLGFPVFPDCARRQSSVRPSLPKSPRAVQKALSRALRQDRRRFGYRPAHRSSLPVALAGRSASSSRAVPPVETPISHARPRDSHPARAPAGTGFLRGLGGQACGAAHNVENGGIRHAGPSVVCAVRRRLRTRRNASGTRPSQIYAGAR